MPILVIGSITGESQRPISPSH